MVEIWAKSIKQFRIYREMKYLTFDFDLWPLGQGHKKIPPTLFICIYGPNLNKIGSVISEKIEFFPPNIKKKNNNNNYRAMTVVHYSHLLA